MFVRRTLVLAVASALTFVLAAPVTTNGVRRACPTSKCDRPEPMRMPDNVDLETCQNGPDGGWPKKPKRPVASDVSKRSGLDSAKLALKLVDVVPLIESGDTEDLNRPVLGDTDVVDSDDEDASEVELERRDAGGNGTKRPGPVKKPPPPKGGLPNSWTSGPDRR